MRTVFLALLALAVFAGGCTTAEMATKAVFDTAWKAAESVVREKAPIISQEITEKAKAYADQAIDKGMVLAAKEAADVAHTIFETSWEKTGVDVRTFDRNGDGAITTGEFYDSWREENERRGRENEPPLGFTGTFWLALGALGLTGGKSAYRYVAKKAAENGRGGLT